MDKDNTATTGGDGSIKLFNLMRNPYVNLMTISSGNDPDGTGADVDADVERQAVAFTRGNINSHDLHASDDHIGPANTNRPSRPTAFLEGLRGLAAFLVYTSHHVSWFYGADDIIQHGFGYHGAKSSTTLPFIRVFFTGGSAAVAIFFVLSGYVLSKSPLQMLILLRDEGQSSSLVPLYKRLLNAAARRPFRLYLPPIGVSLAFAFIMHLPFGLAPRLTWPVPESTIVAEVGKWFVEICEALNPFTPHGIAQKWFPYDPPIWTMAVELKGSMLVFALVAALSSFVGARHRLPVLVVLGLVLLVLYDWAMACFVAGMVMALNDVQGSGAEAISRIRRLLPVSSLSTRPVVYHHVMFLAGWYLLCQTAGPRGVEYSYNTFGWYWLTMLMPQSYYNDEYWRWWNTIGAVLVVYGVLRLRWLQHFLTTRPVRYLGRVSFSLYLTHIPFLWAIGDRIYRLAGAIKFDSNMETWFDNKLRVPDWGPHGLSTRFLIAQMFILPLNLVVAQFCTTVLDEPSVRFSKWVVSRGWNGRK